MKIDPKIIWKLCRKLYNFLFYVANVFFEAGGQGECMGTFLRSYRFEKPPKSTLHFSNSITIGISIQMGICCGSSFCSFEGTVGALHSTWSCFKGNTNCSKPCEILLVVVIISLPVTFCDESRNFYFQKSRHEMCKILNEMSKCQHFSTCLLGANHILVASVANRWFLELGSL